ncbi:alpha/beta fold hydrolase [Kribbella endophytica]
MRIDLTAGPFTAIEYGDTDAPPLVLLHGLTSNAATWEKVAPHLARTYRVIALDQRGHGDSVWTEQYSFEAMRDDLLEFTDRLALDQFLLCGHSMGGTVAAIFAEQYADRLTGLVLVDSPPPDGEGNWTVPPRPEGQLPYDWTCYAAILGQLANPDPAWKANLPAITVPTLILAGGTTSPVPHHKLTEAAARIPHAHPATIEGAGHAIQQTRPTQFLEEFERRFPQ